MGNSQPKSNHLFQYNPDHWTHFQSRNGFDILKQTNSNDNQQKLAELWTVKIMNDQIKMDDRKIQEMYQLRKTDDFPVIKCFGVQETAKKNVGFCGSEKILKVLTERIIVRLDQFPQVTFPECCYLIREAFTGYLELFKKVGPFEVNQKMMGINEQGNFKVWLHENFGMIKPSSEVKASSIPVISEPDMVSNILHVIEQKCEQGAYPFEIRSQLYGAGKGFRTVKEILHKYCQTKQLEIPNKIHPNLKCVIQKNITNNSSLEFEEEQVEPCNSYQPRKLNSNMSSQKNIKKVVNYIQLQPKSSPRKTSTSKIQINYPSHPSQLRGKQRIVRAPQTIIRRLRTPQSISPKRKNQAPPAVTNFSNQMNTPKIHNHLKSETYNFLRGNPNIMAVESVYQPHHKQQPFKFNKQKESYFHHELVESEYFESSNNFFPKQNKEQEIPSPHLSEKRNTFQIPTDRLVS